MYLSVILSHNHTEAMPQSLVAFLEATDFENAVRSAVSLGGDADTMAAIAGAVAEAHSGIPAEIERQALSYLDDGLVQVVSVFRKRFG